MSIEIVNIKKSFGRTQVLNDISLDIPSGQMVALLGPSGSGKTTLLRIIAGLENQSSGHIRFHGTDVSRVHARDRKVGFVFQHYALFRHMTVFENIAFGLTVLPRRERPNAAGIKAKVTRLLEMVQLAHLADRYPAQLSGGQKQRVALARALAVEPQILLLDEPFGALDAQVRKELRRWLRQLHEELKFTSVFVTHDQEEALTMSDRVVVMNNGVIEQIGSPEDIYNEPVNAFVADFIGEANILNGIMLDDCRIQILGKELECVDKGFGRNTPVDVVIRPEDIEVTAPEDGQLVGTVENTTFKGVHYEMSVRCGKCEILIHSTESAEIGSKIGMRVIPFNIQIMNKLLPFYDNVIETTVTYSNQNDNSFEFELEGETVTVPDKYYEEGTKLKITLPPDALSLAGDGVGDLKDLYIESVVYKGEHNEIILESDERKWLMLSDTDEQVATYVPLSFNFSKARFEVISEFSEKEG